jgi:type II secretory pathway component PulF
MKKFIFVLVALMLVGLPLFAGTTTTGSADLDTLVSPLQAVGKFMTGWGLGIILAIIFGWQVIKAYMEREQNPTGVRKALLVFGIVAIIFISFQLVLSFLTNGSAEQETGNFVDGLKGAQVMISNLIH